MEGILRFAGGAALAAYVAGFFVVGAYQARYGIYDFDVLRPRVAVTGIAFIALLTLAVMATLHFFGKRALPVVGFSSIDRMRGPTWAVNVTRVVALYPEFLVFTFVVFPLMGWAFDFWPRGPADFEFWDWILLDSVLRCLS